MGLRSECIHSSPKLNQMICIFNVMDCNEGLVTAVWICFGPLFRYSPKYQVKNSYQNLEKKPRSGLTQ
jgi:hypothetical protein